MPRCAKNPAEKPKNTEKQNSTGKVSHNVFAKIGPKFSLRRKSSTHLPTTMAPQHRRRTAAVSPPYRCRTASSQARQQHMTVRTPRRKTKNVLQPKRVVGGRKTMPNEPSATAVAGQSSASPPHHSTTLWQDGCSQMTCTPQIENAPAAVHHRVHTGHKDQGALASKEAVRGWCQVTQLPDPVITLPKLVHAHNRLPETCCASKRKRQRKEREKKRKRPAKTEPSPQREEDCC